jgi:hypothetical protein
MAKKQRQALRVAERLGILDAVMKKDEDAIEKALAQSQDYQAICELANIQNCGQEFWLVRLANGEKRRRRTAVHEANRQKNIERRRLQDSPRETPGRIADSLRDITTALEKSVGEGDLAAIANGVAELGPLRTVLGEISLEGVEDYTTMTDETLLATALQALQVVHEYEILVLHGSSRRERAYGRATKDRLVEVCCEIGVRHLAERFKEVIAKHNAAYQANLKEVGGKDEHSTGRLSWWNV